MNEKPRYHPTRACQVAKVIRERKRPSPEYESVRGKKSRAPEKPGSRVRKSKSKATQTRQKAELSACGCGLPWGLAGHAGGMVLSCLPRNRDIGPHPVPVPVACRMPNAECHSLHVLSVAHPPQAASVSQPPVVLVIMSDYALSCRIWLRGFWR
jgi:hypothetical protein